MDDKTRKVNVIAFYDDERSRWMVALNLPEVPLKSKTMTPGEADLISRVLAGELSVTRASKVSMDGGSRIGDLTSYIRRNVEEDLFPDVARELHNIAVMTQYNQEMAGYYEKRRPILQ